MLNSSKVLRNKATLFVLSFEKEAQRTSCNQYYLPRVEIKNYNFINDEENFFDQPGRNNLITHAVFEKLQLVKEMIIQLIV